MNITKLKIFLVFIIFLSNHHFDLKYTDKIPKKIQTG